MTLKKKKCLQASASNSKVFWMSPPPPEQLKLCHSQMLCPRLATQFLRLSSNPKAHPGSFPPMPCLSRASTQLGSTSHQFYLFIFPPPTLELKSSGQRRDWLWSTKEPVFFCLLVLPPCPVTTRLSFLLRWLWEELLDKSHASKCLPLMTMWATWSSSGLTKAHIHCFNPAVRGQHWTRLKEFVICKHLRYNLLPHTHRLRL